MIITNSTYKPGHSLGHFRGRIWVPFSSKNKNFFILSPQKSTCETITEKACSHLSVNICEYNVQLKPIQEKKTPNEGPKQQNVEGSV